MTMAGGEGHAFDPTVDSAPSDETSLAKARGDVVGYETQLADNAAARERLTVREERLRRDADGLAQAHTDLDHERDALETALAAAVDHLATLEG